MQIQGPKVTLLDWPQYPTETIYALWQASKSNEELIEPCDLALLRTDDEKLNSTITDTFQKVIEMGIPVAENLNFTFLLENVSISFREQMVRHRIGVKVGDRLGCDFFPDLHESSWWSQSMRILNMGSFATEGNFRLPESLKHVELTTQVGEQRGKLSAENYYIGWMKNLEHAYNELVRAGVPMEDARELIPLGATHRISWTLNLAAIQHIIGKRSCWILQLGVWEPIVRGIMQELATKVDPIFQKMMLPPCMNSNGGYKGCHFAHDNERRVRGDDEIPPCAIWLKEDFEDAYAVSKKAPCPEWFFDYEDKCFKSIHDKSSERMSDMQCKYRELWGIDMRDDGKVACTLPDYS